VLGKRNAEKKRRRFSFGITKTRRRKGNPRLTNVLEGDAASSLYRLHGSLRADLRVEHVDERHYDEEGHDEDPDEIQNVRQGQTLNDKKWKMSAFFITDK
jgi:hypothetical protein